MAEHKVTRSVNNCWLYGITFHKDLPFPIMIHYEQPVPANHSPGFGSTHALTGSVFHMTHPILQEGHDCGPAIHHFPMSVVNIMLPLAFYGAARKAHFSASTVLMEKAPTACCNTSPCTPMMACSEIFDLPLAFPTDNDVNTVLVGMTGADWAAGIVAYAIQVGLGLILTALSFDKVPEMPSFGDELKGALGIEIPDPKKIAVGFLTGAARIAIVGHGSFDVGIGNPVAGGKIGFKKTPAGTWEVEVEESVLFKKRSVNPLESNTGTTKETSGGWKPGEDGTKATKRTKNADGTQTETVNEKTYDDHGRPTSDKTTTTKYDQNGNPMGEPETVDNLIPPDPFADPLGHGADAPL